VVVHENEVRTGKATTFATVCNNEIFVIIEVAAAVSDGAANPKLRWVSLGYIALYPRIRVYNPSQSSL
jgi:hypothetical protein